VTSPSNVPAFVTGLVLILAGVLSGQAPAPRSPASLVVLSAAGRQVLATSVVSDHEMVRLDDLATLFQLSVREDALAGGITVSDKGESVILTPGQSLASVQGRLVSLSAPVVRDGKRWLVPVEFISRALAQVHETKLDFRPGSRLIVVGDLRVPRILARSELVGNQLRITLDVTPKTDSAVVREPNRLLIRFTADALDATLPPLPPQGLVELMHVTDPATTIALDLGPGVGPIRTLPMASDTGGARLVIDVFPPAAAPAPAAPSAGARTAPAAEPPMFAGSAQLPTLRTLVIDPGHGGSDVGSRGASGALEKNIVLSVARRLKTSVENRLGIRVLLTRNEDADVPLDERTAFANNNKADAFLSLHANASAQPAVRGAAIRYLDADKYAAAARTPGTPEARALPAIGGGTRTIDITPWETAQIQHLSESAALAAILDEGLRDRVGMGPRAVERGPFRVLVGANMPAVLIELGYLSNREDEARLAAPGFQDLLAAALLDCLIRFRDSLEKGPLANATTSTAPGATTPARQPR
jgi:N-acetylmuramoyl-L-alanine amidase